MPYASITRRCRCSRNSLRTPRTRQIQPGPNERRSKPPSRPTPAHQNERDHYLSDGVYFLLDRILSVPAQVAPLRCCDYIAIGVDPAPSAILPTASSRFRSSTAYRAPYDQPQQHHGSRKRPLIIPGPDSRIVELSRPDLRILLSSGTRCVGSVAPFTNAT